jgi:NTE family protein
MGKSDKPTSKTKSTRIHPSLAKYKSNKITAPSRSSSDRSSSDDILENVLILQGGGSLGAFGCGVFKALENNNVKIDIVAGTSIGGVNAAIISGSKDGERAGQLLEQFWLELADSYVDLERIPLSTLLPIAGEALDRFDYTSILRKEQHNDGLTNMDRLKIKSLKSFYSSVIFGNDRMFRPRWRPEYALSDPEYFQPSKWTYIYDHSPLVKTLEKYIDYNKLKPNGNPNSRLIVTAVDVLTAKPLTFDSFRQQITPRHILATSAYPLYNFPWIEVEDGVYGWDGGLLSNTPLREVIDASPVNNKQIFLVENYPKEVDGLPTNLPEVYHRARDIIFCDKTEHNVTMSKLITAYLRYIEELYQIIEDHVDINKIDHRQLENIRKKYKKYKQERGAEIKGIHYVTRDEPFPAIYENADFSPETIRNSIRDGESKTNQILKKVLN